MVRPKPRPHLTTEENEQAFFPMKKLLTHDEMRQQVADFKAQQKYERVRKMLDNERRAYESSWLMSERMLHLCHAIESSPASEQLTKCSVLAAQLRAELELYEQTRPMDDAEKAMIDDGWKRFQAAGLPELKPISTSLLPAP